MANPKVNQELSLDLGLYLPGGSEGFENKKEIDDAPDGWADAYLAASEAHGYAMNARQKHGRRLVGPKKSWLEKNIVCSSFAHLVKVKKRGCDLNPSL
jgi:hypothetical protein